MFKIRRLSDGAEIDVSERPVWRSGVWECGNQRFTDEHRDQYEPIPESPPVPEEISPRQIRQALTRLGFRAAVEAAVAAGDQDLKDWWNHSNPFHRHHEQVLIMAAVLGVTDEQLDAVWILGDTL